jgi:methylmalonyl-CoA mutase N-terminal domain/subunit
LDTRKTARNRWEEAYAEKEERDVEFSTMSGVPVKPLYTPEDVEGEYEEKIGYPGEYQEGRHHQRHSRDQYPGAPLEPYAQGTSSLLLEERSFPTSPA